MHYMGWESKWDEWIRFNPKEARNPGAYPLTKIAVRWSKALKPDRGVRRYVEETMGNPWEEVFPGVGMEEEEVEKEEKEKRKRDKRAGNARETNFAEKYGEQLKQLLAMGFTDMDENIAALMVSHGNVQGAIGHLLGA